MARTRKPERITIQAFRLTLPSCAVVRVCKASPLVLAAHGLFSSGLLQAAVAAVSIEKDTSAQPSIVSSINFACQACMLDKDIDVTMLQLPDRMAVHSWVTAPGIDGAVFEGDIELTQAFFLPLVRGAGALLLHAACEAYGTRPSTMLGIAGDAELAMAVDMAVAYRGLYRDADGAEGIVEVEDVFGDKHQVPSAWLPTGGRGSVASQGLATHMDDYARFYGPCVLSAGGIEGGDGMIGPMPGPDGQRHWN